MDKPGVELLYEIVRLPVALLLLVFGLLPQIKQLQLLRQQLRSSHILFTKRKCAGRRRERESVCV